MKYLIPVDASQAALTPIEHLAAAKRRGAEPEVILLNVQPVFHRHVARFSSSAARDELRRTRSRQAMAEAIERLSRAGIPFRALTEIGPIAERIAAVAEGEHVDEILMGVGRHPEWLRWLNPSIAQAVIARTDVPVAVIARGKESALERYLIPAGVAGGIAAIILAAQ